MVPRGRCVDNFFSAAAAALEFAAAVQLRATQPDLPRPFRIPLGTLALSLLLLLPFGISLLIMLVTATHSPLSLALCGVAVLLGTLLYVPVASAADRAAPVPCHAAEGGAAHASTNCTISHAASATPAHCAVAAASEGVHPPPPRPEPSATP